MQLFKVEKSILNSRLGFCHVSPSTECFTSDNEPDGIENATHNTLANPEKIQLCFANVLWVAFSIPSGSFSLVKYSVYDLCY
jgi:hypothetical protein